MTLRQEVVATLSNDIAQLPDHVRVKVEDRIKKAAKKNAALDVDQYNALTGMMEFFDLRELQDTMTAKATWDFFEPRFLKQRNAQQQIRATSGIAKQYSP